MKLNITYQTVPNPNSMKFILEEKICDGIFEASSLEEANRSPLGQKILGFPWAKSIFFKDNFITITKEDWVEWDLLCDPVVQLIADHIESKDPILLSEKTNDTKDSKNDTKDSKQDSSIKADDSPIVRKIKEILENEIQPAVAMDGGYISFVSYDKGKVYLSLQGACSGCPSSSMTLKQGIENRLRQIIPEISEVIPIN